MAITATQRTDIVKVVVGLFNAAPGAIYLNNFTAYAGNTAGLTNDLVADPAFTSIYPSFLTSLEFGTKFVDALVGNAAAAADKQWAAEWIAGELNAGKTRAEVVTLAVTELQGAAGTAKWGAAATQFANKVAVAEYYSVNMLGSATDVGLLQGVVANVTATTDVSTPAALEAAVSATPAGTTGQTFMLAKGLDNYLGTAGNDTIIGSVDDTNAELNTLSTLDVVNGGAGVDTLRVSFNDATTPAIALPNLSNVEIIEVQATQNFTLDTSTTAGVTDLNVTKSTGTAGLTASDAQNISVAGATNAVTVDGGKNVLVNDATAAQNITIGATTVNAGTVTVTDSKQDAGNIAIDGGTDVTVTATSTVDSGTITVGQGGAATDVPSGAVSITSNLNGNGVAAITEGNITVTGGSTVTVNSNLTIAAKDQTASAAHTFGDVKVTGDSKTTSVTVNQTYAETEFTKAAVAVVKETSVVTFSAMTSGQTLAMNGLTFQASKALTAAEVAAAFSNLTAADTQSAQGPVANGFFTGTFNTAVWTSGAASGAVVTFTAVDHDETDLIFTGTATAPTQVKAAGTAAGAAVTSANSVTYGAVRVDGNATASITTVNVNGYASADLGKAGTDLNALTTLSLANSGGAADVATSATTLGLTVNNVQHAVKLDETAATIKTLNATTTGASSTFALTAAAVETLTVAGSQMLDIATGSTLTNLKTVTVSGSASLNIGTGASGANVTAVNSTATTGTVTATIDGTKATYTGGAGVDMVTLTAGTALTKAIDLGAGDDTLVFGATVTGSSAALNGGDGVDTLSMTAANADALDNVQQTFYTGFERLTINNAFGTDDGTVDTLTLNLENLGFTNYVTTSGTVFGTGLNVGTNDVLVLDKLANNGTVVLTAEGEVTVNIKDATTGLTDVLNVLTSSNGATNYGTLTANKVESINITVNDVDNTGPDAETLALAADSVTAITIGNANDVFGTPARADLTNLTLTVTGATALASVDASGMKGVLTYTAGQGVTTVTGGSGNDVLTAAGSGDTLIGGAGNDTLTGADLTKLTGGAGNDIFVMNKPANVNSYSSIMDLTAGDVIDLDATNGGTVVFTKSAITLAGTAVFQDYANTAVNALGTDVNDAAWFQFGTDTYIVQSGRDHTATADFGNGVDSIIKIVGLVDLSTASYNQTNGTLEIA